MKKIPRTISNTEDGKQVIKSSGLTGANYIEANEALSKKDRCHRIRISRKEAKESRYWLILIYIGNNKTLEKERQELVKEAQKLQNILSTILIKLESKS